MSFPELKVRTIAGTELRLPDAFGDAGLVLLAFAREQRAAAESWIPWFESLATDGGRINVLGVVVLPKGARLVRGLLERTVRKHLRDPAQAALIGTAFTDVDQLVEALGLPGTDAVAVLAVDGAGHVQGACRGGWSEASEQALRTAMQAGQAA